MILLFGEKAQQGLFANKTNKTNSKPVENSGILAMSLGDARQLLSGAEYDEFMATNPVAIDYAMYESFVGAEGESFESSYSQALAFVTGGGDCGFSVGGGSDCGASCGSFSSMG